MSGRLWKRHMIVEIPDLKVGGAPLKYEYPPWGIAFEIAFGTTGQANMAKVRLWNLSRRTLSLLERGQVIRVSAGYEDDSVGDVFVGIINRWETKQYDVDTITTIEGIDGKDTVLRARPNLSWQPGVSAETIARDLFMACGVAIGEVVTAKRVVYQKGKLADPSATGADALNALRDDVSSMTGVQHEWFVDLGKGYFRPINRAHGRSIQISKETGLIGTPEQLHVMPRDVNAEQTTPTQWRIVTALNWRVPSGGRVSVTSELVEGLFKVETGKHIATPEDQFETDLVCSPLEIRMKEPGEGEKSIKPPLEVLGGEAGK